MKKTLTTTLLIFLSVWAFAQSDTLYNKTPDKVSQIFLGTRVVNTHSVHMIDPGHLVFRVSHRFGDLSGDNGGFHNFYGLDNLADVRIAFEYGINDRLSIGVGRSKGAYINELFDGYGKILLLRQTADNSMPISLAVLESVSFSAEEASEDESSPSSFGKAAHRFSFVTQLLIARKFGERLSLQVTPTYVHRNYVADEDENAMFAVGMAGRFRLTKVFSLLADYFYTLPNQRTVNDIQFQDPLGFGLEIKTGGHVFTINVSNSRGLLPNEFIPHTTAQWGEGEYRIGFTITRPFRLSKFRKVK